jgi:hypothetical protein
MVSEIKYGTRRVAGSRGLGEEQNVPVPLTEAAASKQSKQLI